MKENIPTPIPAQCCECSHAVMLDTVDKITGNDLLGHAYKLENKNGLVNVKEMAGCQVKGTIRNYEQAKIHCPLMKGTDK